MTEAEFLKDLQEKVANGTLTAQAASDQWLKHNLSILPDPTSPSAMLDNYKPSPSGVSVEVPNQQINSGEIKPRPKLNALPNEVLQRALDNKPDIVGPSVYDQIQGEVDQRAKLQGMSFLEALMSGPGIERFGKAILKGPAQTINSMGSGIPGIIDYALGDTESAAKRFEELAKTNEDINQNFGSPDAANKLESLGEVVSSAIVPGGLVSKLGSAGVDFTVDQTVRELTGDKTDQYSTIFDSAGLTDNKHDPILQPMQAGMGILGLAALTPIIAATAFNPKMLGILKGSSIFTSADMVPIRSLDRFAPDGLHSVETSGDALMAYAVDSQAALTRIVKRAGVPNPEEITKAMALNTGSAARTRISTATDTGQLHLNGVEYNAPVAPKRLLNAANKLDQKTREKVARYIHLYDMMDDAHIAIANNAPGDHLLTISNHQAAANQILATTPEVQFFHDAYKAATAAIREVFAEHTLLPDEKLWLDTNRPNYVPIDISSVDKTAPLMTRMGQAQRDATVSPEDWFLRDRESDGNYDPNIRNDPFELLQLYTENALSHVMKNKARMAIVDGMLGSPDSSKLIMLKDPEMNLQGNEQRAIKVERNGVKETYLTSSLLAGISRFDPYVALFPKSFATKRMFEKTATGKLTMLTGWFAPKSLVRDSFIAQVLRPDGFTAPSPLEIVSAIPKQVWADVKHHFAESVQAGLDAGNPIIPPALWNTGAQQKFVTDASTQYTNSLYHMLNTEGGFDATINTNNIQLARGALGELSKTIKEADFWKNPAFTNIVTKFGATAAREILHGFVALNNAVLDAPRFATAEKAVKSGMAFDDAAMGAKRISGDTSKTGTVYTAEKKLIRADALDQGMLNVLNPHIGYAAEYLREATPYYNPIVQGTRNLITRFQENPLGTMFRAHLYIGLPATAAIGWNEMLGKQYNEYAMSRRSADDVAGSIYVGLPGLPPEQGLELYIPQELMLFNAPYTRSLYGLLQGENYDQISEAMQVLSKTIFANGVDASFPTVAKAGLNVLGVDTGASLSGAIDSGYIIKEDNVGMMPQNFEVLAKTLFARLGTTAIETMYILTHGDNKFDEFLSNAFDKNVASTSLVSGLSGRKTANTMFSIPAQINRSKDDALKAVMPYWQEAYNTLNKNKDGLPLPEMRRSGNQEGGSYTKDLGLFSTDGDLPFLNPGPSKMEEPTNPFVKTFVGKLDHALNKNNIGLKGIEDRLYKYGLYTKQLRKYNSGDSAAIKAWEDTLKGINNPKDPETQKMKDLIETYDLNLTQFTDRVKLINIIENEASFLTQQKLEVVRDIEDEITKELQVKGLLPSGEQFSIENDLKPFDNNPHGISMAMLIAAGLVKAESPATP